MTPKERLARVVLDPELIEISSELGSGLLKLTPATARRQICRVMMASVDNPEKSRRVGELSQRIALVAAEDPSSCLTALLLTTCIFLAAIEQGKITPDLSEVNQEEDLSEPAENES